MALLLAAVLAVVGAMGPAAAAGAATAPEPTASDTSASEPIAPDPSASEPIAPEPTGATRTTPEPTAPDTSALDTSVPDTSAPDPSVPGPVAADPIDADALTADPGTAGTGLPSAAPGTALAEVEQRMLTVRPTVGPTWVVPVGGLSTGQQVLLRTLQGIVNRTQARLYLTDPSDRGAQRWLDTFEADGLVTVEGTTDLAGAVERFASEAAGYVLADPAVPWTVQVAATVAAAEGAVVASPAEVALLEDAGLALVEDVRGRWPDAATAFEAVAAARADDLPHAGVAVMRADDRGLDFAVQQGMAVLFTRPDAPDWGRISALITDRPAGTPVFGYLSDTGEEEAVAVGTLSAAGLVLVPTDTTRNLSYQVAVGADRPREVVPATAPATVAPCTADTLNVVVGLTDGDNVNVPLNTFSGADEWGSPRRGDLPIGWSLTPALAVLAPAAWDTYVREASGADELVGMIGWGYGVPSLMADAAGFYELSFALMDELGMRTFWSLGGGLETPGTGGWRTLDAAAATTASATPDGVLVGYGSGTGVGRAFHSPAGRPALTSGTAYRQTPAQLAAQVEALLALPADQRPLVSFLAATNWSNPAGRLIEALEPFVDRGVRFLTPAEATACTPPPVAPPPVEAGPGECLPAAEPVQRGLALISDAAAADMARTPTPVPVAVAVTAPPTAVAGEQFPATATITVDLSALAASVLEERVRPLVEASYGGELAASAFLQVALSDAVVRLPTPAGTTPAGAPAVLAGPAIAAWSTDTDPPGGAVEVAIPGPLAADTRTAGTPTAVEVGWSVAVPAGATPFEAVVPAAEIAVALDLTIGVTLGTVTLTGGASAPWACTPLDAPLARTAVSAAPAADLRVAAVADATEVVPGDEVAHLVGITNVGAGTAADVLLDVETEAPPTLVVARRGWLARPCAITGRSATCALGALAPGASTFVVVTTRTSAPGTVALVARASSAGADADPTDDVARTEVAVVASPGAPDVGLVITADPLVVGETGRVVVHVDHDGPRPATGVEVRVEVPEGIDLVGATRGWFRSPCELAGRIATCRIPRLGGPTFVLLAVRASAPDPRPGSVEAAVTADEDADASDDRASLSLEVRAAP